MLLFFPTELFKRFYAPVTWALILLNSMVFFSTHYANIPLKRELERIVKDERYLKAQGLAYAEFIQMYPDRYSQKKNQLAHMASRGKKVRILSLLAFNDALFIKEAFHHDYSGDQVAMEDWKLKFARFLELSERGEHAIMGLHPLGWNGVRYITYQFNHSGVWHFMGNMIFLLLFGTLLESILGGLAVLVTYLLSGFFAGLFFLLSVEMSTVTLVGASGSVSGLVALYSVIYWKRSVRFLYLFFIPKSECLGFVYLPGWVLLLMWGISDLTGVLSFLEGFNGVAYIAHLGGECTGALVGFLLAGIRGWDCLPYHGFFDPPVGTYVDSSNFMV